MFKRKWTHVLTLQKKLSSHEMPSVTPPKANTHFTSESYSRHLAKDCKTLQSALDLQTPRFNSPSHYPNTNLFYYSCGLVLGEKKKANKQLHAYLKWNRHLQTKLSGGKNALDKILFLPAVTVLQFILDNEFNKDGKIISVLQGTHIMYPNY